jgi:hypothetical protein
MSSVALAASQGRKAKILRAGIAKLSDLQDFASPVPDVFLDAKTGATTGDGLSWDSAVNTMARALAIVQTGGRVFFRGKIAEEVVGSNLKFDVSIIGVGSKHHADEPSSAYHPGASVWQAPASPTATTPLIKVRGRGWNFINILFDCPVDSAAIYLERNASSGTDEYDASHASIIGCDFRNGKYGIQDVGGVWNIRVEDCDFETLDETGGCGIINTSTSVAAPRRWVILNNRFQPDSSTEGSLQHIDSPLQGSTIKGNVFGTVKSTGIYVDLTGGEGNVVWDNLLMGAYNTSDYVAGSNDSWAGNQSLSASFGGSDAQGRTLTAPASAT